MSDRKDASVRVFGAKEPDLIVDEKIELIPQLY